MMVDDEPLPAFLAVGEAVARRELPGLTSWEYRERVGACVDGRFAVYADDLLAEHNLRLRT